MNDEQTTFPPQQVIRLDDLDKPVHRIFPLWFFEEALRVRQLVLVAPRLWEDPFETIDAYIAVNRRKGEQLEQIITGHSLPPVYAQCWSASPESDTLLRAYSRVVKDPHFLRNTCPRDEGVRVRSTPRKLFSAVLDGTASRDDVRCYIGLVQYMEQVSILHEISGAIGTVGPHVFEHPDNRAKLLLMKRQAFFHEAEVRLISIFTRPAASQNTFGIAIDPNAVFDEVTFDPRLAPSERSERETVIRSLGYKGPISESRLYERLVVYVPCE